MDRVRLSVFAACAFASSPVPAQGESPTPVVTLGADEYLVAGADAIRGGLYDDGIRMTLIGLERSPSNRNRAAGLANVCAAYVAKNEPDNALPYCDESLALNPENWRAYSNRAHAYFLQGRYAEAERDNAEAAARSPHAAHVQMIRKLLNERLLRPEVVIEEHR
jgi:tetratricopeptide (TPR) repeat protein